MFQTSANKGSSCGEIGGTETLISWQCTLCRLTKYNLKVVKN